VEIAGRLDCDNTTVTRAIRELMAKRIVCTGEKKEQLRGRPRTILQIDSEGPLLAGVSFEVHQIIGVVTDLHSRILRKDQILFEQKPSREFFLSAAEKILKRMMHATGDRLAGIGAAVFGSYSGEEFTIQNAAAMPELNGVELRLFLEKCTGREVFICDHMIAKMYCLKRFHHELNRGTVMLLSAGTGIGNVMIDNGRPMFCRGRHGGEFGHSVYVQNGRQCSCGRRGCLETVISTTALLAKYRELKKSPGATLPELFEAFRREDADTVRLVRDAAVIFGTAIANQLNNYPVDTLAVTGRILSFGPGFCSFLEEFIKNNVFRIVLDHLQVRFLPVEDENYLVTGVTIQLAEEFVAHLFQDEGDL